MLPSFLQHWIELTPSHWLWVKLIGSFLTSILLIRIFCPRFIQKMRTMQASQPIRQGMILSHNHKANTPTMGGIMIVLSILLASCLWVEWESRLIFGVLLVLFAYGCIGALDDWLKIKYQHSDGLSARWKYAMQSFIALLAITFCFDSDLNNQHLLFVPMVDFQSFDLGLWSWLLSYFVIVGASNAVNLTDGLDGLAIVPSVLVGAGLGVLAYLSLSEPNALYYGLIKVDQAADLIVFCAALVGAGVGFLRFNVYPAQIFMGDVGALALGGALGAVAVCLHQEILLFIMGGVFVAETLSVILQVASFKLTGRRVFKMAPLHHHFELSGWGEAQIVLRFWLMTFVLVVISLVVLRFRGLM